MATKNVATSAKRAPIFDPATLQSPIAIRDFVAEMGEQERAYLLAEALKAQARVSLLGFCSYMDGTFTDPAHIRRMAQALERVERSEIRRLVIELPPRHAKSSTLHKFGAWYLGRNPTRHIITASHSAELAERNSRLTRNLVADDRFPFPASHLSKDTTAQSRWVLSKGGGLMAVGVLGSITGHGADLILLDDIEHDERSVGERRAAWEWYSTICAPRLEPGGAIVVVCTRWAEDDVAGRMLVGDDGQRWERLILPAIALEGDPLGRSPGEALWPERFPLPELHERQKTMGSRSFSAQFQQDPLLQEGVMFKVAWLQRYASAPVEFKRVVMSLDAAAKTGISNDFSVILTLGVSASKFYVLDVWRRRVEFPDLIRALGAKNADHKPSAIYVEDTSNAVALIQALRVSSHLPIVPVQPHGSKISRVESTLGLFESGRVLLPEDAPWLVEFESELLHFPHGKHDDQVDALEMALTKAALRPTASAACFTISRGEVGKLWIAEE